MAVEAVCPAASSAAMGRANWPGLNRLLDHAVRRMPHVQWADVTERGFAVCDIDRERVQLEWWIVDPYAKDPGGTSECAAVRALRHEQWPCRLDVLETPSIDPSRPPLTEDPGRPADLSELRAKRLIRLTTKGGALVAALAGVAVGGVLSRRPSRS